MGSQEPINQNGGSLRLQDNMRRPFASCAEVRAQVAGAQDGTYVLFTDGDLTRPRLAACHDLAGTPTESAPVR